MGRIADWGLVVAIFAVSACVPSKESRSAGQIGCLPEEITISNEQLQPGLVQSGETWVAECHGRTFVCSQLNPVGQKDDAFAQLLASEQLRCTEELESPEAEHNRHMLEAKEAAAATPKPPSAPPLGAAGFDFGQSLADAQQSCEQARNQWQVAAADAPTCSGTASDVGFPASVGLRFCGGRECAISLQHRPSGDWANRAVTLKAQLESKYGSPDETSGPIPKQCRVPQQFAHCLEQDALRLRYVWHWASGEGVEMLIGKPDAETPAEIRLIYTRAAGAANVSAL